MARPRFAPPTAGSGGGANMNNMLKQAQKMQEELAKTQEAFSEEVFEVTSGGGAIKLTIDGKNEIREIKINPDVVDPDDVEMLEDLIVAALNEAIKTVESKKEEKLGKITGGLGLPGLF